eukprot:scaffold8361_cov118-Isochrysis_galbana.AAC.8
MRAVSSGKQVRFALTSRATNGAKYAAYACIDVSVATALSTATRASSRAAFASATAASSSLSSHFPAPFAPASPTPLDFNMMPAAREA